MIYIFLNIAQIYLYLRNSISRPKKHTFYLWEILPISMPKTLCQQYFLQRYINVTIYPHFQRCCLSNCSTFANRRIETSCSFYLYLLFMCYDQHVLRFIFICILSSTYWFYFVVKNVVVFFEGAWFFLLFNCRLFLKFELKEYISMWDIRKSAMIWRLQQKYAIKKWLTNLIKRNNLLGR